MVTGLSVHLQGKSAICIRPDTDGSEDLKRRLPRTIDQAVSRKPRPLVGELHRDELFLWVLTANRHG